MNCYSRLFVLTGCLLGAQLCTAQGPITPSAAPAPMMKTLQEMEPRGMIKSVPVVITQSGSYYFTGNLVCTVASTNAITVNAPDVTIDMRGFTLANSTGSSLDGISSTFANLKVINGNIIGFDGGAGIKGTADKTIIKDVKVEISNYGIDAGDIARVENVSVLKCTNDGIICGAGSVITECRADENGGDGIRSGQSSVLTKCTTIDNSANGIHITQALEEFESCAIIDKCTANLNIQCGILAESGANIMNCAANGNGFFEAVFSTHGIFVNTSAPMTPSSEGSIVRNCTANNNTGDGIRVVNNTEVIGNSAAGNGKGPPSMGSTVSWAGIAVYGNNNLIKENTTSQNIGDAAFWNVSGILINGLHNRIEANHSSNNGFYAYEVMTVDGYNLVVKNSAYGNAQGVTDYSIAAGNHVGTIIIPPTANAVIDRANTPPNVGGLGIAGTVTDTPWANFDD